MGAPAPSPLRGFPPAALSSPLGARSARRSRPCEGAAALGRAPRSRCGCRLAAAAGRRQRGYRRLPEAAARVGIAAYPRKSGAAVRTLRGRSQRCIAGRGPPPPSGGGTRPAPRSSVARGGPGSGPAPSQPVGLRGAPGPGGRGPRRCSRRLPPGCGVRARSGAARPSLPPLCGGSPALFAHSASPLAPGPLPLRGAAPARRARALSPPPAGPPGSLARPLCGASRLRGRSLAPSGSRAALRSAAGSPIRGRPCSLRASRAPARGPAGPPRRSPFGLRGAAPSAPGACAALRAACSASGPRGFSARPRLRGLTPLSGLLQSRQVLPLPPPPPSPAGGRGGVRLVQGAQLDL